MKQPLFWSANLPLIFVKFYSSFVVNCEDIVAPAHMVALPRLF